MIVAHRGASYDAPENTLAAFRLAWQQNADGIEGDFYLTADNQIVCIHDRTTKRTTGVDQAVDQCTLDELQQLEAGSWKGERWRGETLPSFAEVLAVVPNDKTFVIELKVGPEIVGPLAEQLSSLSKAERDRFLIISFQSDTIAECKRRFPDVRAHWLTGFKRDEATDEWTPAAASVAATVAACQADGVGMNGKREVIDAAFLSELRRGGVDEFHVWTIDDPADARYFQQLGAIGITTNRPGWIRERLPNAKP
jgi:glycerophosphoryl diester phosphodiesterase